MVLASVIMATFLRSPETNVVTYEHRQLYEDWTTKPFVDIVIVDEAQGCPPEYEIIV